MKTYDRQSYKESLDKLYNTMIDLKKRFEPRKKFKFSRRDEDFGVKLEEVVEVTKMKESAENSIPGIVQKAN